MAEDPFESSGNRSYQDTGLGATDWPRADWVLGYPQNEAAGDINYTGGFFLRETEVFQSTVPPGFKPWTRILRNGSRASGFATPVVNVSIIRWRECWKWEKYGGREYGSYPISERQACVDEAQLYGLWPKRCVQLLCHFEGFDDWPMTLNFKGMAGSQVRAKKTGILAQIEKDYVANFKRLYLRDHPLDKNGNLRQPLPMRAFRYQIGGAMDGKTPRFVERGEGERAEKYCLPEVRTKPPATVQELGKRFVGDTYLDGLFEDWFEEAEAWVQEWDKRVLSEAADATTAPESGTREPEEEWEDFTSPNPEDEQDDLPF